MKVDLKKITTTVNKISDMTSGDKIIPGVMLTLAENKLDVCYHDGHKAFVETLDVETDETDKMGSVVVELVALSKAIANCQPSGIIKVSDISFKYNEKTITVSAEQSFEITDAEGNVSSKKVGKKNMELPMSDPASSMKTAVLSRMNYDNIFESDGNPDEFNKDELINALLKTSSEKGKQIYFSTKTQNIFVANQAHLTAVPISGFDIPQEELDVIMGDISEQEELTTDEAKKEAYAEAVKRRHNRMHYSICVSSSLAKSIASILNNTESETVYIHTKDKFCNIYANEGNERVGIWFEMPQASKAHIGALERYGALKYSTYQVTFIREFLSDVIKSALNSTKSEKITFKFTADEEGIKFIVAGGSSASSTANVYSIIVENAFFRPEDTIIGKEFSISLKVFFDMLSQIKTDRAALDFDCSSDGSTCIRLSEMESDEMLAQNYEKMRKLTAEQCAAKGEEFIANATPTPIDIRFSLRGEQLLTKQYTILAK